MKKGFTLIELLVVIAIIGVLSSVVLASLNSARNKGSDTAVKQNLANVRAQAEIYYDDATKGNGKYQTGTAAINACSGGMFSDVTVAAQINAAKVAGNGSETCRISADGQKWLAASKLKSSQNYWCVDYAGNSKSITTQPASGDVDC